MTAIVTNKIRVHNAKQFVGGFDGSDVTPIYGFIGRTLPWTTNESPLTDGASDTGNPGMPYDSRGYESKTFQHMLQMKKINAGNVVTACRNMKWTSGVYFNPYRHDYNGTITVKQLVSGTFAPATLAEANYYTVSDNKVYICLKAGPGASTVDPKTTVGTSYTPAQGIDRYIWKFISERSTGDATNLSSPDYFPVRTVSNALVPGNEFYFQSQSQNHAIPGAIYAVLIESGTGSGWGSANIDRAVATGAVKVIGNGTLNTATTGDTNGFEIRLVISSNAIVDIEVVDPGQGFSFCTITGLTGVLPNITPIITPKFGLGYDPITDLNAYYVLIGMNIVGNDSGKFTVANEFRQFGLISSPISYGTTNVLNMSAVDCTTTIVMNSSITVNSDQVLTLVTGRKVLVVDTFSFPVDYATVAYQGKQGIRVISPKEVDDSAANIAIAPGQTFPAISTNTILAIVLPEWEPQSGELLYVENRKPIARAVDQGEDLRVVIEF